MDLEALRTRTRTISGIEMESLRSNAEVNDVINDVYLELLDSELWPFLEIAVTQSTVAGTDTYSFPTVARIRTVTLELDDGPHPLSEVSKRFIDRNVNGEDTDEPVAYARSGSTSIVLAPTPDAVYDLRVAGYMAPTALSVDTDEPVFEERFHAIVAYAAAAVLLQEEGQTERADQAVARVGSFLDRMRRFYLESADDAEVVMGRGRAPILHNTEGRLWPWRRAF